jgi:hypothetical protein
LRSTGGGRRNGFRIINRGAEHGSLTSARRWWQGVET